MVRQTLAAAIVVAALATSRSAAQAPAADNQPVEPFRIADNLYYVGSSDIASYLVTTTGGHILIDGGYSDSPPITSAITDSSRPQRWIAGSPTGNRCELGISR